MTKSKQAGPAPRRRTFSDPLEAWAPKPPPNETLEEKERRLTEEFTAKKHSDGIDDMLREERNEQKRPRNEVKLLLLGQSESGKSTTLKQFQLLHTPAAFHAERIAWRAVIYLNLVRSIRRILDAISPEAMEEDIESTETASIIISSNSRSHSASKIPDFDKHRKRLEPLVALEERLIRLLSAPDENEPTHLGPAPGQWEESKASDTNGRPSPSITIPEHCSRSSPVTPVAVPRSSVQINRHKEITVHTSTNWKKAFELGRSRSPKSAHSGEIEGWWEDPDDPVHLLNACAPAMDALWHDPRVRDRLEEKRLRLEESSGFFLDDIRRITALKYIPTNEDVLKARLKTMGVVEHRFTVASGNGRNVDWRIYDVGGARNQRAAWVPYFEDVNAIIFLAPISAFDQVLVEDNKVNRLEDSLLLWKTVVSNKLLHKVNLILFLNKADLLQAKLDAGVRLNQHMVTYGDRPNDFESIAKYFRNKFGALHQSFTPNKERELYIHFTSVTDTRHTSLIIANVRDIIVKANLRTLKLV